MRKIVNYIIAASLAFSASSIASMAQTTHARLDAINESRDLRVDVIRRKMDQVRSTKHRPTVALVLSGGGAN